MEKLLRFLKYITFFFGFYALILCAYIHSQAFVINESESIFTSIFDVSTLLDKEGLLVFLAIALLIANCLLAFLIKFKYDFATRRQTIISVIARASAFILSYVILNKILDSLAGAIKNAGTLAYIFIVLFGWLFILTFSVFACLLKKSTKSCCPEYTPSDSPTSYSSTASGTEKGASETSSDVSPSGRKIIKRFSKNAYIERDAVHYEIYVNCFYDNHGTLCTVDNGSYKSKLEEYSRENERRFYGTDTYNPIDAKIVDVDGKWWYIKLGDGFYDSRRHYCVIRGNYI